MNIKRIRTYRTSENIQGPVVLWMSRDQRMHDNWALIFSQNLAIKYRQPLCVVFSLAPDFLRASLRQYDFMLMGLREVERDLCSYGIPFYMLFGNADETIPKFVYEKKAGAIVSDFSPLKIHQKWVNGIKIKTDIPFYQVDAHNIVPCWIASSKQEYAAYTFRPKIKKMLPEYLEEFTALVKHPFNWSDDVPVIDWATVNKHLNINKDVAPVKWLIPGGKAGYEVLNTFIKNKLDNYHIDRNDPLKDSVSNISAYLHFGQISAQRAALLIKDHDTNEEAVESYLEELIVRRELSDNFCLYNQNYDNTKSFPKWSKDSLGYHLGDKREYIYDLNDLESYNTHDILWNACQKDLKIRGKLHGYLRMYWAKKILEWSSSPDEAMHNAIFLNDKYSIDGRDPNGYTGIAWSIGGVHDRAWFDRSVFGKVRYMSFNGSKSKFNVKNYVEKVASYVLK